MADLIAEFKRLYPEYRASSNEGILEFLSNPANFRKAFPEYKSSSNEGIKEFITNQMFSYPSKYASKFSPELKPEIPQVEKGAYRFKTDIKDTGRAELETQLKQREEQLLQGIENISRIGERAGEQWATPFETAGGIVGAGMAEAARALGSKRAAKLLEGRKPADVFIKGAERLVGKPITKRQIPENIKVSALFPSLTPENQNRSFLQESIGETINLITNPMVLSGLIRLGDYVISNAKWGTKVKAYNQLSDMLSEQLSRKTGKNINDSKKIVDYMLDKEWAKRGGFDKIKTSKIKAFTKEIKNVQMKPSPVSPSTALVPKFTVEPLKQPPVLVKSIKQLEKIKGLEPAILFNNEIYKGSPHAILLNESGAKPTDMPIHGWADKSGKFYASDVIPATTEVKPGQPSIPPDLPTPKDTVQPPDDRWKTTIAREGLQDTTSAVKERMAKMATTEEGRKQLLTLKKALKKGKLNMSQVVKQWMDDKLIDVKLMRRNIKDSGLTKSQYMETFNNQAQELVDVASTGGTVLNFFSQMSRSMNRTLFELNIEQKLTGLDKVLADMTPETRTGLINRSRELLLRGYDYSDVVKVLKQSKKYDVDTVRKVGQTISKRTDIDALFEKDFENGWQWFNYFYNKYISNPRRVAMVFHPATQLRNIQTQGGILGMGVMRDAFEGMYQTIFKKTPVKSAFSDMVASLTELTHILKPGQIGRISEFLQNNLDLREKLLGHTMWDINKSIPITRLASNVTSKVDQAFKYMILESYLGSNLKKEFGIDIWNDEGWVDKMRQLDTSLDAAGKQRLQDIYNEATRRALDTTFSGSPEKRTFFDWYIKLFKTPFFDALVPFARFRYNDLKLLFDYSPAGFMRFFNQDFRERLAAGDKTARAQMGEALVGSIAIGLFTLYQKNRPDDIEWYQIPMGYRMVNGERRRIVFDLRTYSPFIYYAMIGQIASNVLYPESAKPIDLKDVTAAIVLGGGGRLAGSSLFFVDLLTGRANPKSFVEGVANFFGRYIGAYTRPLSPIAQTLDKGRARSLQKNPLFASLLANIPFAREALPELPAITRPEGEIVTTPYYGLRAWLGLSLQDINELEGDLNKLGIKLKDMIPRYKPSYEERQYIKAHPQDINQYASRVLQQIKAGFAKDINDIINKYPDMTTPAKRELAMKIWDGMKGVALNEAKAQFEIPEARGKVKEAKFITEGE